MIMERAQSKLHIAFCLPLLALIFARSALACDQPSTIKEAAPEGIRVFFKGKNMKVPTCLGYSGAEYENKAAMLE